VSPSRAVSPPHFPKLLPPPLSHSRRPVDSMREAVLTVSPNRQYRGMVRPTTPATHGPAEMRGVEGQTGLRLKLVVTLGCT
jgi:hypothetical protein